MKTSISVLVHVFRWLLPWDGMQFGAEMRSDSRLQFGGLGPGIGGPETLRTAVERMGTEQAQNLKAQSFHQGLLPIVYYKILIWDTHQRIKYSTYLLKIQ